MKHNWIAALSIAAAFAVSAHAQTPAAAQPDQKDQKTAPAKITLTGCVERADQVASAGATAATADSLSFMLINASKDGAAESRSETVGTSGTAAATKEAKGETYRLDAEVAKLNPHVGHKVEVTGVVDSSASAPAASGAASRENAPKIKVETVKMLAETCAR